MANDLSDAVAWYKLESGALTTDSTANGNTLTNSGPMTADTVNYAEGLASGLITFGEYQRRNDADLSAAFPCKSGTANTTYTIGGWFRPTTMPGAGCDIISKAKSVILVQSGTSLDLWHYYGESSVDSVVSLANAFVDDAWSHIAVTYDDATQAWVLYSYVGGELKTTSGTFAHAQFCSEEPFRIGQYIFYSAYTAGNLDEIFVYDRVLSADEIADIRGGTYDPGPEYVDAAVECALTFGATAAMDASTYVDAAVTCAITFGTSSSLGNSSPIIVRDVMDKYVATYVIAAANNEIWISG